MKTIKMTLAIISFTLMTGFTAKNNEQISESEGYYYFAYASLDKYQEHIYITPLLYISKSKCDLTDPRSNYGIENQYKDYIKAEYNGVIYNNKAKVFSTATFSEAEATKARREVMKLAKSKTKILDFKYLCD